MRTECSECGATYSAADACRICAKPLSAAPTTLLSPDEADRLRSAHASRTRPAPVRGGSGLVDIRQMSAQLRAETREVAAALPTLAAASGTSLLLPSFAGHGLDGLSAAPLMPAASPAPSSVPERHRGPLYALLTVLTLGVLGLGALVIVEDPRGDPPADALVASPAPIHDTAPTSTDEPEAPIPSLDTEPAPNTEHDASPVAAAEAPSTRASTPRRPRPRPQPRASTPAPAKPTPTKPEPALGDDALVDCLLGSGSACKRPSPGPDAPSAAKPAPSSEPLPTKLGQSAIIEGIRPVKSAAKGCGSGLTVAVKFSVEGSTGKVISAKALDEHANSAAGACVVAAARAASFAKFSSPRQGFTFKFRL